MIVALVVTLIVLVPHPDDETTLLPIIEAAGPGAIVVVMTDGAASAYCSVDCRAAREYSTTGFLAEQAPGARVVFLRLPDQGLDLALATAVAFEYAAAYPDATLWAAGADYGHPDHDTTRAAVAAAGGLLYGGEQRHDPGMLAAVVRWYGWLGIGGDPSSISHMGLAG